MPEPVISYPPELPVAAARDEIAHAIRGHQVVVVAGATGSGKTTQLPKICLELGRVGIAHTQPRRIAARTVAERIAEEMNVPLGGAVGYKVRFTDRVSSQTRVALMTDGILLNEVHRDRLLRRYDTVIIDEAHERSLNVDFLLGYLTRILPERDDLKVIVTSATIDPQSFADHFSRAIGAAVPIVEVSGRTYPVEIRYRPLVPDVERRGASPPTAPRAGTTRAGRPATKQPTAGPRASVAPERDEVDAIVTGLRELDAEAPGDVLVFLPGESEIRDAADAVRAAYAADASPTEVLPLYGRLSAAEQHRVFERSTVPGVRRRVVLATNVAETSLTVPGIRYVIDAGTARISRYSPRAKVQRLPIEAISQASAQQRSGRAGRTSPGIAIRLYGEDDFDRRPEYTDPEILRTSLASVILQMLALGFGDISAFPFLTPPDARGVTAAVDLLVELGAVTLGRNRREPRLTKIGRTLSRLPMDPRFARMIVEAGRTDTAAAVIPIVAGMSIQDVRERPEDRREHADQLHSRFTDPTSDFLSLLNLWNHVRAQQSQLGSSAFRRLCRTEYLNYVRVREWFDVDRQLRGLARGIDVNVGGGFPPGEPISADPDAVHRALLSGLLSHIGTLDATVSAGDGRRGKGGRPKGEYLGARGVRFAIFPGSGLKRKRPQAVMAAELVETSRLFGRTVAAIDPAWAEPLAGDLAKRRLTDPHWSRSQGAAVAVEKVTLFGVEIIPRRRVQLARLDRPLAREMFVRHALVEQDWDVAALDTRLTAFVRANRELRRRLEKVEERERRRDILVGDEAILAFYDARVPRDVFDTRSFETWWKEAASRTPKLLTMREADLVDTESRTDARDFPSRWHQADQTLTVSYRFEPGADDDGVTIVVPVALLASLRPDGFDWQVPGMRDELIAGLLRALPKAVRRHVVPAADWADRFAGELADEGPENRDGLPGSTLAAALARRITHVANQPVTADTFDMSRVPPHLRVSFRAVDDRGTTMGTDRDLTALQVRLADHARASVAHSLTAPTRDNDKSPTLNGPDGIRERDGLTTWDLGVLPDVIDSRVGGGVVRGYPSLVDDTDSVSVRVQSTPDAAAAATRAGVRRLVLLTVPSPVTYVLEHLTHGEKLVLAASPYPTAKALIEDCRVAVTDELITSVAPTGMVRDAVQFDRVREAVSAGMVDRLFACVSMVAGILASARDVEKALKSQTSMALLAPLRDIRGQLDGLVFRGFASRTGTDRLAHLPRYLEGMRVRLTALADNPGRDRARLTEYEQASAAYADAGGAVPPAAETPEHLVRVRWLLEEYRVSLFAQRLGTAEPVSARRIAKALVP